MKSLKNVYRNLFEFDSRRSRETSVDAKVSLTLPGVGTFEITPLQSILIAYTMKLFIDEADFKKELTRSVAASNDDVVKDSENLLAASKQYFNSFSLLESQGESRWSASGLRELVNEKGEVLPELIRRVVESSTVGVRTLSQGYGYFIEALINCYIYKDYKPKKEEGFKTSGDIKEFKSLLLSEYNKFFVTVYNIINNENDVSANNNENVYIKLVNIEKQYNSYDTGVFVSVYASILNKKAEIFEDAGDKLDTLHTSLIAKLGGKEAELSIKAAQQMKTTGYDFTVNDANGSIIGFINTKSTNSEDSNNRMTSSFKALLRNIINDSGIEDRVFFLGNFIVTNSANLLSVEDVGTSEIIVVTEITCINDLIKEPNKVPDSKFLNDNFADSSFLFSDKKVIDDEKRNKFRTLTAMSDNDVDEDKKRKTAEKLKYEKYFKNNTVEVFITHINDTTKTRKKMTETYRYKEDLKSFHRISNITEKYEKFYKLVDYNTRGALQKDKKASIINSLMQKDNTNEFTIVTWAVQIINKKQNEKNKKNKKNKKKKSPNQIRYDNWKYLFKRLHSTSAQTLKDVKNTIEKNSVILERIDKEKEDVKESYEHFMKKLSELGVPPDNTGTQVPSDEETTTSVKDVLVGFIVGKNIAKNYLQNSSILKSCIDKLNMLDQNDKEAIWEKVTKNIHLLAPKFSRRHSLDIWANYAYIRNRIGLDRQTGLGVPPDNTGTQVPSDEETTEDP